MKIDTVISIGMVLAMWIVFFAAILVSHHLLFIGLSIYIVTAPVFAFNRLGIGKALGIYKDAEKSK